jgi:hypothetical protein
LDFVRGQLLTGVNILKFCICHVLTKKNYGRRREQKCDTFYVV